MTRSKNQLLLEALPFIQGFRDGHEWDDIAVDLAEEIESVLLDADLPCQTAGKPASAGTLQPLLEEPDDNVSMSL